MKNLLLLALIGWGFTATSCDKNEESKIDPATSLLEYVGKSYAKFAYDARTDGYEETSFVHKNDTKTRIGYKKNNQIIAAIKDSENKCSYLLRYNKINPTISQQLANIFRVYDILMQTYNIYFNHFERNSSWYDNFEEFDLAIQTTDFNYLEHISASYKFSYNGKQMNSQCRYYFTISGEGNSGI